MSRAHRNPSEYAYDVQFILKCRNPYEDESVDLEKYPEYCHSSGLMNSAMFIVQMLREEGYKTVLDQAIDANCIDRIVTLSKPVICILEALWVTPTKLRELAALHPKITWVVRLHSNTPFLANEGIALEWISEYFKIKNVIVAGNNYKMVEDLYSLCATSVQHHHQHQSCEEKVGYLPNYYETKGEDVPFISMTDFSGNVLDVGCFGAIRPLKNQLQQAVSAIAFCDEVGFRLRFHINSSRVEQKGENILKNLRALFAARPRHELVEHEWLSHHKFVELVAEMDLGMQVSFTETFNIVAADFVRQGIPVVVSKEIDWLPEVYKVDPTDPRSIRRGISRSLTCMTGPWRAMRALKRYSRKSMRAWNHFLSEVEG